MSRTQRFAVGGLLAAGLSLLAFGSLPNAMAQGKKAIVGTGTGTIKGKVTLDGEAPKGKKLNIDPANKDKDHCLKGDTEDPTWEVGPGNGLANVVVYLKAPPGSYFKVDMNKKSWPDEVAIDQPFCAFRPHVSIAFPEYEGKPTGQKFLIKNSAPIGHNSRIGGTSRNPVKNENLKPGGHTEIHLKPDAQVIKVNCDVHKWMESYVWAFDHPYAAVTKEDGTFEIKNVPTGVEVTVMAWHEAGEPKGKQIKKGTLKDGEDIEFKIKKK